MRIFGLVIKKKSEYDEWERVIIRMVERLNELGRQNEALKERIKQYESGKRCAGGYCLDVPCPDFKPEEDTND